MVLLHGVLMNGTLWDELVGGLGDRYRCIVPELPFGAHTTPMPDDADLSLASLATMIAGFLTELDLRHVTLVCNDSPSLRRPVEAAGSRGPLQELDPSAASQLQGPPRPHQVPPQRPQAPAAVRVGRPAALLRRPGPHHLGARRQAHAPHPRRTPRRTLPEHPTRVDRRQPNPHPHRPTAGPSRPPPHLSRHAHLTPAVPRSPRAQTRCAPPELRRSVLAAQAECRTPMTSWA